MHYNNPFKHSFWVNLVDEKIGRSLGLFSYFKQSIMATLTLLCFFLGWNYFIPLHNQVLFSAIASSTFLTFISTSIYDSLGRKIIGGQIVGIIVGLSLWHLMHYFYLIYPDYQNEIFIVFLSLSVGMALFFMAVLNFEHPPAAGTAMAFVFKPIGPVMSDVFFIIICAIILALTHTTLKKYQILKDLEGRDRKSKKTSKLSKISRLFKTPKNNKDTDQS